MKDYKIEVGITPKTKDNEKAPYYWILYGYYHTWCNVGNGWEKDPQDAWNAAYHYYEFIMNQV